jgi:hypothetical protein
MQKYPIMRPIPSRYDPAKSFTLTKEQRWQLDFELVNEADMREINSRSFEVPNAYEQRARWFEKMAQGYILADLINQLFEFRSSSTTHNEVAFAQLYELGRDGNEAAACMAERFHRRFQKEITSHWSVTYDQVALSAVPYINSQHPVCSELERAKRAFLKPAVAGFFINQSGMQGRLVDGKNRMDPKSVAAYLCWARVADRSSVHSGFSNFCESYRLGIASDIDGHPIRVPSSIQTLARQWCEPNRSVTPQDCAQIESQLNQ